MNKQDHKKRHLELHKALDELIADFMNVTGKLASNTSLRELMEWSHKQTMNPSEKKATGLDNITCCFCGREAGHYGNNALPVKDGRCCDECNDGIVVPIRLLRATKHPFTQLGQLNKLAREGFKP